MNSSFFKRRYTDVRFAITAFAPIISYSNFILIAYNFTDLKETIPFEIFAPLFTAGIVILLTLVGKVFRAKQQSTDLTLSYEKAIEANKTALVEYEAFEKLAQAQNVDLGDKFRQRKKYLEKIASQKS